MTLDTANEIPVRQMLWMPWRWHRWGRRALPSAALLWLLAYVASYPIVETWQGYGAFHQSELLNDFIVSAYWPLALCAENSDLCLSLYLWELCWLSGSDATAWMLPEPVVGSGIYNGVPNADGSAVNLTPESLK